MSFISSVLLWQIVSCIVTGAMLESWLNITPNLKTGVVCGVAFCFGAIAMKFPFFS